MTRSPCYKNGHDCEKRHVGCRADCKEWQEWTAIHEQEREQRRKKAHAYHDVEAFLWAQGIRIRAKEQEQSTERRKGGIR